MSRYSFISIRLFRSNRQRNTIYDLIFGFCKTLGQKHLASVIENNGVEVVMASTFMSDRKHKA